jgi:inner membrane protein
MIIGHAPSGYIAATLLHGRLFSSGVSARAFIIASVLGAVAPDLDMLYFHLIDQRQHHHHSYFSHWPVVWLGLLALSLLLLRLRRGSQAAMLAVAFSGMGVLHLLLDSIVGDIWWFAPLLDQPFALFSVPALYKPWWLNFLLHWSFALELALWLWALLLYRRRHKAAQAEAMRQA